MKINKGEVLMKRLFLVLLLVGWAVMVYKTIQVPAPQPDGFLGY
jgi:hypothetical protein